MYHFAVTQHHLRRTVLRHTLCRLPASAAQLCGICAGRHPSSRDLKRIRLCAILINDNHALPERQKRTSGTARGSRHYGPVPGMIKRRLYMHLQESGEMYLETILILSKETDRVRSVDVCDHMGFSKPSVSRAVGLLKNSGYIVVDDEGHLSLTGTGRSVAEKIYERHTTLTECLMELGVDRKTAADDACKIEHDISDKSFEAIKKYFSSAENK